MSAPNTQQPAASSKFQQQKEGAKQRQAGNAKSTQSKSAKANPDQTQSLKRKNQKQTISDSKREPAQGKSGEQPAKGASSQDRGMNLEEQKVMDNDIDKFLKQLDDSDTLNQISPIKSNL